MRVVRAMCPRKKKGDREMRTYTLGDGVTGRITYSPARITRKAMSRIGRSMRPGWRAVGITDQHQILVINATGYWYVV